MNKRTVKVMAIVLALATGCVTTNSSTEAEQTYGSLLRCKVPKSVGKLATVRPILAGIPGAESILGMKTAAKGGVMTAYLVTANSDVANDFTVGDWIHVWIDGADYKDVTRLQLRETFGPEIIVDNIDGYNRECKCSIVAPPDGESFVVRTKQLGAAIPPNSTIDVEFGAGWNKDTEKHRFRFVPDCFVYTK